MDTWSIEEVEAIVKDYFVMLNCELHGEKYSKTEHRQKLAMHLNDRSEGAIEMKHQNISAVLDELDMPFISGYKPFRNYQRSLLPDAVLDYLANDTTLANQVSSIPGNMQTVSMSNESLVKSSPQDENKENKSEGNPKPNILEQVEQALVSVNETVKFLYREANSISKDSHEQLVAVQKAIKQLNKRRIEVPDRLLQIKSTLLLEVSKKENVRASFDELITGIFHLVNEIRPPARGRTRVRDARSSRGYTNTIPKFIQVGNQEKYPVHRWCDVVQIGCNILLDRYPKKHEELCHMRTKKLPLLSRSPGVFRQPISLNYGLYAEGCRNANGLHNFLMKIIAVCGDDPENFKIEVERID